MVTAATAKLFLIFSLSIISIFLSLLRKVNFELCVALDVGPFDLS